MSLAEYKRKRNFKKTPEPAGKVAPSKGALSFVIQKHDATRLHYDFRLELDGTLKSWAVPKGPSLDPSVKSLAVHVEDHPLDYADFEGIIPEGQYGGGTVMVWDQGAWQPEGDVSPQRMYKTGKLKFQLHGQKLRGSWALVRMGGSAGEGGKNWLLIKHDDRYAKSADDFVITEKRAKSVVSKRTLEQIAKAADRTWYSNRSESKKKTKTSKKPSVSAGRQAGSRVKKSTARPAKKATTSANRKRAAPRKRSARSKPNRPDPADLDGARPTPQPRTFQPQLATLAAEAPTGPGWLHELKFDGYRILAMVGGGKVRLVTRRGNDWTPKFQAVADAVAALGFDQAIFDGEVVSLNEHGVSDFQLLQNQLKRGDDHALAYYIFDVPHFGGYNLTRVPLVERKDFLEQLLEPHTDGNHALIRYSEHLTEDAETVWTHACRGGLEGIICKRADGEYVSDRTASWLKVKCTQRQEFVIGGYSQPSGSRSGFGALLIGYYANDQLQYAGKCGTGFTEQSLRDVQAAMNKLVRKDSPFASRLTGAERRGVTWVEPKLVAEVEFTEWTDGGHLRHPSFQGLREDKPAASIIREKPMPARTVKKAGTVSAGRKTGPPPKKSSTARPVKKPGASSSTVAGIAISNPDRVVYPGTGITKLDLARYYESVADWILPGLVGRPLSLVRCPAGQASQCFFQKHINVETPPGLHLVPIKEKTETDDYVVVDDISGVVSLVQMGVMEIHPWPARDDNVERPDFMVFDLDPAEDVDWPAVVQGAKDVRACLEAIGLESFLRTSGGKGLHVVAPFSRRIEWDDLKEFARGVAETMVRAAPDRYVANMSKAKRKGKIFVDYLRNQRGATAIASYSTRARSGAPIAVPIAWDELTLKTRPNMYTVANIHQRLSKLKSDPWRDFYKTKQSITAAMRKAVSA